MGSHRMTEEFKVDPCFNNLIVIESQCKRKVVDGRPICGNLNQKPAHFASLQCMRDRKFANVAFLFDGKFDVVFVGRRGSRTKAIACEVKDCKN